ncbi:FLYWCH zinc finger domain-containing protein [Phthorimaea operculella]|nr:FLYWCH zinc finger domain-containing protein [Phthorimaea operculella]
MPKNQGLQGLIKSYEDQNTPLNQVSRRQLHCNIQSSTLVATNSSTSNSAACEQPIRFETTRHGNPIIAWGRYRFTKKLQRKEKAWWECTARRKRGCHCILVTRSDRMVKLNGWHNH